MTNCIQHLYCLHLSQEPSCALFVWYTPQIFHFQFFHSSLYLSFKIMTCNPSSNNKCAEGYILLLYHASECVMIWFRLHLSRFSLVSIALPGFKLDFGIILWKWKLPNTFLCYLLLLSLFLLIFPTVDAVVLQLWLWNSSNDLNGHLVNQQNDLCW